MDIPKIDVPTYDITLPSNGKTIVIRPFLVKEEKLLLMAVESQDNENIIKTTKQVINNCIVAGDVDIDKLPFFDIDYIFIALRAKSIGEKIETSYVCNNLVDDQKCGGVFETEIDISNCVIDKKEDIETDIVLSNKLSMKMKYPTYSIMKTIMSNENNFGKKIRIIASCIERITNSDKIYSSKDFSKEELIAFIDGLTREQFVKLEKFVDNLPTFHIESEATCPKCGYLHKINYTDFTRFFQ
jgi:hypothetical protein